MIQLERLGDLVQTTPLLQDLLKADPECLIDLLVLEGNQIVVRDLPGVDPVRAIPEHEVAALSLEVEACFRKRELPTTAAKTLKALDLPSYDRVINVTHNAFGCWIAPRISAHECEGGYINDQGEWLVKGPWHIYLVALIDFREENLFNLVDLYRGSAVTDSIPARDRKPYCFQVSDPGVALPQGEIVALNPGAHRARRRWPAAFFAKLARMLAGHGLNPVLVGAPADREVCSEVIRQCGTDLPDYSGKTTLPQMARLLADSELLVSNDTGAVHLAAAAGTPVVGLFGVTAFFRETSPWGEGHLILQTPLNQESASMEKLAPEVVCAAVLDRLGRISGDELSRTLEQHNIPAWETYFLPQGADPLGGLAYRPLHAHPPAMDALLLSLLRHGLAAGLSTNPRLPDSSILSRLYADEIMESRTRSREWEKGVALIETRFVDPLRKLANKAGPMQAAAHAKNTSALEAISTAAGELKSGLDELKAAAVEHRWAGLVIAYLDWKLRLLPPLDPIPLFKEYEKAYLHAASLFDHLRDSLRRMDG